MPTCVIDAAGTIKGSREWLDCATGAREWLECATGAVLGYSLEAGATACRRHVCLGFHDEEKVSVGDVGSGWIQPCRAFRRPSMMREK